jgi:hypothetical protein
MEISEYISREEVRRICSQLDIRDWTNLASNEVELSEAEIIQEEVAGEASRVSPEEFRRGLEVELEHGTQFPDANVTNNHPLLTGKIVLAHLKESLDYYARLEIAELEGDMLKSFLVGDSRKLVEKYKQLIDAKYSLSRHEHSQVSGE